MRTKLTTTKHTNGRTEASLEVELNPAEMAELEKRQCSRSVDSPIPIPCTFYQTPNPEIRVVRGIPIHNGTPIKSYILEKARKVALNRALPNKCLLRIYIPGVTDLGYANERDIPALEAWWEKTHPHIVEQMKERLFGVIERPDIVPEEPKEQERIEEIDPWNENEKRGVRRRSLDDY